MIVLGIILIGATLTSTVFHLPAMHVLAVLGDCPNGFIRHDENCYHFSHDTETWIDALVTCDRIYGAQLAEPSNTREAAYLISEAKVLRTEYWIGADDMAVEGEWKWATSKQYLDNATVGGWLTLSNSANNENCLELNGDHMNDDRCDKSQHYVCQLSREEPGVIG